MHSKKAFLFIVFSIMQFYVCAQQYVKIYGTVKDAKSGETLPSATIWIKTEGKGATTNRYGYYLIKIKSNTPTVIQASYIGYEKFETTINTKTDTVLNIYLIKGILLSETTVKANKSDIISNVSIGKNKLPITDILFLPSVGGESNLIASLKTLPGVSAGKEGSSELYVRGGSFDHNLILLDGAPVYNLNHAFGLVSIFNTVTIKDVTFYKGAIPARYGGSLSSVLDVSIREGNNKKIKGNFNISTLAASITAEGPIKKDKASFLFSFRRSWPDLFFTLFSGLANKGYTPGLNFMDINGKVNFTLDKKNHFYINYYTGQDKLFVKYKDNTHKSNYQTGWGNHLATIRWNTISNKGIFYKANVYYSRFSEFNENTNITTNNINGQKSNSYLNEYGINSSVTFPVKNNLLLESGVEGYYRKIQLPSGTIIQNGLHSTDSTSFENQYSLSSYISSTYNITNLIIKAGLRLSMFGEEITNNISVEPRITLVYKVNDNLSLKTGAMTNKQNLYAMPKTTNGFPGYSWIPLTGKLNPEKMWQVSVGATKIINHLSIDIEGYYKKITNIAGNHLYSTAVYPANELVNYISQGKALMYGIELFSEYKLNHMKIRSSYTLANSKNSFEDIDNGNWFPTNFDIRHNLTITGEYYFISNEEKRNWLTCNFSFHTGIPFSLPDRSIKNSFSVFKEEDYDFDFSSLNYYEQPNNYRFKSYHRLDLGFNNLKHKQYGSRVWSFGIINIYNRQNTYLTYRDDKSNFKQLILFPIMPYISLKINF